MPKAIFNIAYTSKYPSTRLSPSAKAEYFARRDFYSMNAEYNYFSYTLNSKKVVKNKDMFSYMTNDEKSTGAFNLSGSIPEEQLEDIKKRIKKTDSHIWHGVISFDEDTSKDFLTQEDAVRFMKQNFNAFLQRTHLNANNLEIIATLHEDTDNRHIHFTFFEKEPKHRDKDGNLCFTQKGTFRKEAIENYIVSANMYLSDNADEYYKARDRAIKKLGEMRANAAQHLTNRQLRGKLLELNDKLPSVGRLSYNSNNIKHLRRDIDAVADMFIKSNTEAYKADQQVRAAIAAREKEACDICAAPVNKQFQYVNNRELRSAEIQQLLKEGKTEYVRANNISWENIDVFEKLRQDYKARIGNQILGLVMQLRTDPTKKSRATFNDKQRKLQARQQRHRSSKLVTDFMNALGTYQQGVQADFTQRLHQVQHENEMAQYAQAE